MSLLGFSDSLLVLFRSYLMNRQHCVRYCNCMSNSFVLTSGVLQGSYLGSLLFLIFINDLPANVSCNKLLFADDLKLYHRIYSVNDCLALQHNANVLSFWSRTNLLQINEPKCYVMSYTNQKGIITLIALVRFKLEYGALYGHLYITYTSITWNQ